MDRNDADATANVSNDYVLYDGACPACSRYIAATGLAGTRDIALIDARTAPALVAEHAAAGRKIDDSMVVAVDGVIWSDAGAADPIAALDWVRRQDRHGVLAGLVTLGDPYTPDFVQQPIPPCLAGRGP